MTLSFKLSALANPELGFVRNIRLVENSVAGHSFANAWVACPPLQLAQASPETQFIPVSGYGSGRTAALDRLMMEAVERNSSIYTATESSVRVSPSEVGQSLRNAYALPSAVRSIECIAGRSVVDGRLLVVPAVLAYLGYPVQDCALAHLTADSNGCAAGETSEAATLRGTLEVIERDAVAIWWFNRVQRPAFDYEDDALLCSVREVLGAEGRSLAIFDLHNDIGVPVAGAITADAAGGRIYIGAAAALTRREAAQRAALEMFQFWLWGRLSADPPERVKWLRSATLTSEPWLITSRTIPLGTQLAMTQSEVLAGLLAVDCEPISVCLTRPWFQIPVVRVIAPGLRSLSDRREPGRLFTVPVQLGWREQPVRVEDLNPFRCPI